MAVNNRDFLGVSSTLDDGANYSGGVAPATGDDARYQDSAQSLSVNMAGLVAVDLEDLFLAETYTGNMGLSGSPLEIDCTGVFTCRSGGQECWAKGDFPEVHAAPLEHTANAFVLETRAAGNVDRLFVLRGRTRIVDGSDIVLIQMVRGANDAKLIVGAGTTISGDLHIPSGVVELDGTVSGIVYVSGTGRLVVTENASVNRLVQSDGMVEWQHGDFTHDVAGVPTILVTGGFFDAHALARTHTVPRMWALGSAARLDLRTGMQNIIRTASKSIGTPQIKLDDGDTF